MKIWRTAADRPRSNQEAADARKQLLSDYRVAFGGEAGQRVLVDLLRRCGVMATTYQPGQPDATAYAEGRRRIGLEIIDTLNADPEAAARLAQTGEVEDLFPRSEA